MNNKLRSQLGLNYGPRAIQLLYSVLGPAYHPLRKLLSAYREARPLSRLSTTAFFPHDHHPNHHTPWCKPNPQRLPSAMLSELLLQVLLQTTSSPGQYRLPMIDARTPS